MHRDDLDRFQSGLIEPRSPFLRQAALSSLMGPTAHLRPPPCLPQKSIAIIRPIQIENGLVDWSNHWEAAQKAYEALFEERDSRVEFLEQRIEHLEAQVEKLTQLLLGSHVDCDTALWSQLPDQQ